jgi:DNA-directed RNA polymerase specialized sigma24 family protein
MIRRSLAPMASLPGSVTCWIDQLKAGDAAAAQALWESYYKRLVALARHKLRGAPRAAADEDDVALSAFDSLCRGAGQGRFPQLTDRDDLWRLLFAITERKALDHIKYELRLKRGGGMVRHASALDGDSASAHGLDRFPGAEPTPELAAQVAEQCRFLLDRLADDELRRIAVAKMEGYTNKEIAEQLSCSLPRIERKLARIRKIWAREADR